jgi:hypothetical protein
MQGGGKIAGDATLEVDGGPAGPRYGPDQTAWFKPVQVKDQLTIQFIDSPFGWGPFGPSEPWVRVMEGTDTESLRDAFADVNLGRIDELKDKLRLPRTAGVSQPPGPRAIVVRGEPGEIYLGRLQSRDMRTGQPMPLAFKAMVEEMQTD